MITFNKVTKQFKDGTVATDNVSFHIEPGELVVITGPSGSGKTTLMKLLIKDFSPTEGEIVYKDQNLAEIGAKAIPLHRRKIGVVFQDYRLLAELNVWENIALPLSIIGKDEAEVESRVTDLLNLVSLTDRALVFPKQLSGGEAQRVSIARALAMGPSVIFADEPTGNLDKEASLKIMKLFQQINSLGTTVLIATHDVTVLDYLKNERQLDLKGGKLTHDSQPKKIPEVKEAETVEEAEPKPVVEKDAKQSKKTNKKEPEEKEAALETDFKEAELSNMLELGKPIKQATGFLKNLKKPKLPSLKMPKFGKKESKEDEQ